MNNDGKTNTNLILATGTSLFYYLLFIRFRHRKGCEVNKSSIKYFFRCHKSNWDGFYLISLQKVQQRHPVNNKNLYFCDIFYFYIRKNAIRSRTSFSLFLFHHLKCFIPFSHYSDIPLPRQLHVPVTTSVTMII